MGAVVAAAVPLVGNGAAGQVSAVTANQVDPTTRRKNRRTAILLGVFAVLVFFSSVPFWQNLVQTALNAR